MTRMVKAARIPLFMRSQGEREKQKCEQKRHMKYFHRLDNSYVLVFV